MLNKIYIHYIITLFVLESFIISCWLLKGKKIGIGIGQFARKKSVSESATKNHDRCITKHNPVGQTDRSLQKEKDALQEEMKERHFSMAIVDSKMELTFSLRRKEIVDEESLVADVLKQWPALFLEDQVSLSI